MNTNTVTYYTIDEAIDQLAENGLYTMETVQSMINEAILSERRKQKNQLRQQETEKSNFIKQKISGMTLLISGIISLLLGAGSYSLFAVPFGLYLMITKKQIMDI